MKPVFVSGTDTDIGKTLVSAVLLRALGAAYWKPVQCGLEHGGDVQRIRDLCGPDTICFPEAYRLNLPQSPHAAARAEGIRIEPSSMELPTDDGILIVEGAGGLMVPLNDEDLLIDWAASLSLPLILISFNRLGSINHSLLSVEAALNRHMDVLGIVFNGPEAPESERFILDYSQLSCLGRIPWSEDPDSAFVDRCAAQIRTTLLSLPYFQL